MSSKKIDILNIGLIFISLILAFKLPFELFLFSYAVLGPLHYLTEINWLNKKNFFVKERKWIVIFIYSTVLISIPFILTAPMFSFLNNNLFIKNLINSGENSFNKILTISFLFAIGLVLFRNPRQIFFFFVASVAASLLILKYISFFAIVVGIFLPTIIHVYLFTLLFMLFGTLHTKNNEGIIAIIFLILCPVIIFMAKINASNYQFTEFTKTSFIASGFNSLHNSIGKVLGTSENNQIFISAASIKIQIFIAFCYTYHYLNWFSKTSIIGWHKNVSKQKILFIIMFWIGLVSLYWYNYKTGIIALFFLSLLHVVLEFPLNIASIKGIISKTKINFRLSQ